MPFEPPEEFTMDDGPGFVGASFGVKIDAVVVMVNPRTPGAAEGPRT